MTTEMSVEVTTLTRMGWVVAAMTVLSVATSVLPIYAQKGASKTDSFLEEAMRRPDKRGWTSVIARVEGDLSQEDEKKLTKLHVYITRRLKIISSLSMQAPTRNLKALSKLSFIKHLSADVEVKKN